MSASGLAGRTGIVTGAVASGLFAARLLGEFIPDALAACVCMFGAGWLAGFAMGILAKRELVGRGAR